MSLRGKHFASRQAKREAAERSGCAKAQGRPRGVHEVVGPASAPASSSAHASESLQVPLIQGEPSSEGSNSRKPGSVVQNSDDKGRWMCVCLEPLLSKKGVKVLGCGHILHEQCRNNICNAKGCSATWIKCPWCGSFQEVRGADWGGAADKMVLAAQKAEE